MTSQFDPFASANTFASRNGSTNATNAAAGGNKNNNYSNPFDVFGFTSSANQNNNGVAATTAAAAGGVDGGGMASIMNPFQQFASTQQNTQQQPTLNSTATSAANNSSSAVSLTSSNASKNNSSNNAARHKRVVPYNGPIADLQSNWDPWLYSTSQNNNSDNTNVNMTYLIVKTNSSCIIRGGVETVLKWMKVNRHNTNNATTGGARMMDDLSMNLESSMSLEESDHPFDYDSTNVNNNSSMNNDIAIATSTGGNNGNKKFGKLFKSGLKKAQASISHSVTNLAIKADGGKNPDLICASLHYLGGGNNGEVAHQRMMDAIGSGSGVNDVCLSKTDWIPLPSHTVNNDGEEKEKEVSFAVPLCVPDLSFLESGDNATQLTVRLYLRSGAKFLAAAIKKEYCIGECTLMYSQILVSNDGSGVKGQYRSMNLSFTNGMLADPSTYSSSTNYSTESPPPTLHLVALPRIKFNPSCRLGWSLTDPTPMPPSPAAALRWLNMFQLPLDQAYSYPLPEGSTPAANGAADGRIILANECARESTVTLPIATACSKLFSDAAMQSQQRASMIAAKSRRRESVRSYAISPEMDANRANAIVDMALKDGCMEVNMGVVAFVLLGDNQSSSIGGIHNLTSGAERVPSIRMSMTFQRHDSIFEEGLTSGSVRLLDEQSGASFIGGTSPPSAGLNEASLKARFCPRILSGVPENDGFELLHGVHGTKPSGQYVGNVRFEVVNTSYVNVDDNLISPTGQSVPIEGLLELEPHLQQATSNEGKRVPVLVPAIDANNGNRVGTIVLTLQVRAQMNSAPSSEPSGTLSPASSGLVSVVGLDTLMEDLALTPNLDNYLPAPNSQQHPSSAPAVEMRRRQVATMGSFLTPRYLQNQADGVRSNVTSALCDRYDKYYNSIKSGLSTDISIEDDSDMELYQRRSPRPFRPSNSRGDELLAGIGFNVHCQGLSIDALQNGKVTPAAVHYSITHGAPADHAAGFGTSGGLRRLEMKRLEFAKELDDSISGLIRSVGDHFKARAQVATARQQADVKMSRHIPPGIPAIAHYRNKAIECAQKLNSLTWNIAVRRANCFSQALGIAVTSYLASLSDGSHASKGFAHVWPRHGYLVTFEGLLSAVGKELGMIEDAAIAVQMLRKVSIVLLPDDGNVSSSSNGVGSQRIPVPHSPYLKWVRLVNLGSHSKTQYRLEIGLCPSYYQNRVPDSLKNGIPVRLFPVLFQMGVDIRQWGVNAGRNVSNQIKDKSKGGGLTTSDSFGDVQDLSDSNGGLIDDGDEDGDEVGIADNEIGFQLNVDGFRKLNAYAHSVKPTVGDSTGASSPLPVFDSSEQMQVQNLPPHPLLVPLSDSIRASAGKMEHSVLDHAAASCQNLGGGSTVFCKSGKDRTGMQVTFKEAQFIQRFIDRKDSVSGDDIFAKATTMRIHGNRVPICEKNAGEAKYAFNPLQAQFMPAMLKPPPITTQWKKPET